MIDVMNVKFKSCPFCGMNMARFITMPHFKYAIACDECGVRTKEYDSLLEAADAWNKRTDQSEPVPESIDAPGEALE